ncbi:MAG TPA: heme o synthase [Candidatus Saccharimonadales bacterium]|nr:heme o synthase [Candidatus Saccharimonadales bacterium]
MKRLQLYYKLTKPGIIYGNLLMAISGFLLAAEHFHSFTIRRLIGVIFGISLVVASACVYNNMLDRGLDQKMARTKNRALVTGEVSASSALVFASALGLSGFVILALTANWRTVAISFIAIFSYVVVYGWAKRNTVHGTLVGAVPGAIPPAAGYVAVSNRFDGGALLLFLILVLWQMAHFYSIAMYRYGDYKSANLPVMPVRYGMAATRFQIMIFIAALMLALACLTAFSYEGYVFLIGSVMLCVYWFVLGVKIMDVPAKSWGKRMFFTSLIVLIGLSVLIPIGSLLA